MKIIICFSALFVVVLASEQEGHEHHAHQHHEHHQEYDIHGLQDVRKACLEAPETRVDFEVIQKRRRDEPVELPANFNKHLLCVAKGGLMIDDDGKVLKDGIKTHIGHVITDKTEAEKILNECAVNKEDGELTAAALSACLKKYRIFGIPPEEIGKPHPQHHH